MIEEESGADRSPIVAVIFAGGIGSRMNSQAQPKQFLEIHGKPIIVHTLEHFEEHPEVDAIAIAILPEGRDHLERLVRRHELSKVRWIVDGGATGQQSRHAALVAVANDQPPETIVLIHDGVRPVINRALIDANLESVRRHGSAITCTKFNETVISTPTDRVEDVIPRDHIYAAQAPQSFRLQDILSVYERAVADGELDSIDSCTLMHSYGYPLHRVVGPRSNLKITTAEDYYVCRTFFDLVEGQQISGF
ncbi:IspD/TarI family cytidylyltransferase [Demetria terragena]|uniref:IspD/TarI family cytidylyltransferase n=1 Tax=Demetria terragena TaxID=63959 RepID=UPI000366E3EA|nr:IspD/TarI family cytidylyltransferase [Demetria terragena]